MTQTTKITGNGKFYYSDGVLTRDDGPAVEWGDGTKIWYKNGKRHRVDGPAIECSDGTKIWMQNEEYHREDGPAIDFATGQKEYYLRGKKMSKKTFDNRLKEKN